jgi:hypothetical protein
MTQPNEIKAIVGICRHDNPHDVDEAYGEGTYARLFPSDDDIEEAELGNFQPPNADGPFCTECGEPIRTVRDNHSCFVRG